MHGHFLSIQVIMLASYVGSAEDVLTDMVRPDIAILVIQRLQGNIRTKVRLCIFMWLVFSLQAVLLRKPLRSKASSWMITRRDLRSLQHVLLPSNLSESSSHVLQL